MSLTDIVQRLNNDAVADELVDYIHSEGREEAIPPDQYLIKYFAKEIRKQIFEGSDCTVGGIVTLSNRAILLRDAFQRRFAAQHQFAPMVAYHGTKDITIAKLILKGGFDQAREQLFGPGVYFYVNESSYRAESIAIQAGKQAEDENDINLLSNVIDPKARLAARESDKQQVDSALFVRQQLANKKMAHEKKGHMQAIGAARLTNTLKKYRWDKGCVLKVTIYANTGFNNGVEQQHKDRLIEQKDDILVVKNPLVVFTDAVFVPGDMNDSDVAYQSPAMTKSLDNLHRLQTRNKQNI